jgi:putative membrane protein
MEDLALTITEQEENEAEEVANSVSRRAFLSRLTAAGLGVSALGVVASADASNFLTLAAPRQPQPQPCPWTAPQVTNEKQFRMALIAPAELSLETSKIAISKAASHQVREFAGFDLSKAIAITNVLKELRTPAPHLDTKARTTLANIKAAPQGQLFDTAYIQAQLENHVYLRDLTHNYLKNSMGKTNIAELHTRHLATLNLAVFQEHLALSQRILGELQA